MPSIINGQLHCAVRVCINNSQVLYYTCSSGLASTCMYYMLLCTVKLLLLLEG